MSGSKIAADGNITRLIIKGQAWVREEGWQPIETAPKDGSDILCWGPAVGHIVASREGDDEFPWSTLDGPNYHRDAFVSWWPLPKPPTK